MIIIVFDILHFYLVWYCLWPWFGWGFGSTKHMYHVPVQSLEFKCLVDLCISHCYLCWAMIYLILCIHILFVCDDLELITRNVMATLLKSLWGPLDSIINSIAYQDREWSLRHLPPSTLFMMEITWAAMIWNSSCCKKKLERKLLEINKRHIKNWMRNRYCLINRATIHHP